MMNMQDHILAALREQIERWETLLDKLSEEQITTPLQPSQWSIKDEMAHLRAWQQVSIARVEAALLDRDPVYPTWPEGLVPDSEETTDQINAWIYETNREQSWIDIHRNWREGYQRLLEMSTRITERDLLDSGRYAWLGGYSLVLILLATYDHHQEHLEKLLAWLREHGVV